MLLGFGWAVIQASRARLVGKTDFDLIESIDRELDDADHVLRTACRA